MTPQVLDRLVLVGHVAWWAPFAATVLPRLRVRGGRAAPGATLQVVAHAAVVVGVYAALVPPLALHDPSRLFPPQRIAGAVVFLTGLAVVVATLRVFRSWRLDARVQPDHELCERGPFAWVRHPIYAAFVLWGAGTALWVPTLPLWVLTGLLALVAEARARAEERLLVAVFGERYVAYAARTARLVPGIW